MGPEQLDSVQVADMHERLKEAALQDRLAHMRDELISLHRSSMQVAGAARQLPSDPAKVMFCRSLHSHHTHTPSHAILQSITSTTYLLDRRRSSAWPQ